MTTINLHSSFLKPVIIMSLSGLLLSACGGGGYSRPTNTSYQQPATASVAATAPAEGPTLSEALQQGNYRAAADHFLRLANKSRGEMALRYQLIAGDLLLRAGDTQAARVQLSAIEANTAFAPFAGILRSQILLAQGLTKAAQTELERLPNPTPTALNDQVSRAYAALLLANGNTLEAADILIKRGRRLPRVEREDNSLLVWQTLNSQAIQPSWASNPLAQQDAMRGWLELTRLAQQAWQNPKQYLGQLQNWNDNHPGHLAQDHIWPQLYSGAERALLPPAKIAILLPQKGRFAQAARAIHDGFLAAHLMHNPTATVDIRSYDTGTGELAAVDALNKAREDGAELIIGPLRKEAVAAVAAQIELDAAAAEAASERAAALSETTFGQSSTTGVSGSSTNDQTNLGLPADGTEPQLEEKPTNNSPVLALNVAVDSNTPSGFFQLGLDPRDEAHAVAERAIERGMARGVALVPAGRWGSGVFEALVTRYSELGGEIINVSEFDRSQRDFAAQLRPLLKVDASQSRSDDLSRLLGEGLVVENSRRGDIDFVFIAANPVQTRQIKPQLKFLGADELPVLATTHAYNGQPNPKLDRDLTGVEFVVIPWQPLEGKVLGEEASALEQLYGKRYKASPALFALGFDAYKLMPLVRNRVSAGPSVEDQQAPNLAWQISLQQAYLLGGTGRLSIDEVGRVRRKLNFGRFDRGIAYPVAPSDSSEPKALPSQAF